MKIAIDARFYGHENGGLGRYTINLLRELSAIDHKNHYFVLIRKQYKGKLNLSPNFEEIVVEARHYSLREQFAVPYVLHSLKPDLVHFLHFNVPLLFNGNFIVTIHDLLMHTGVGKQATTLPLPLYKIKRLGYRTVFDAAVRKAQHIIVPTNFVKAQLEEEYPFSDTKTRVIYEGVDPRIAMTNSESSLNRYGILKPYFLYVGNAYPHKNLTNAILATKQLVRGIGRKLSLVIVTPKDVFAERLEATISQQKAKHYVKVLGKVTDVELSELYSGATAFLYPSLSEGFGLPALEAMSTGTPVIASDIPVFKEVYEDQAVYFDPLDPQSIARKMREVLSMTKAERTLYAKQSIKFVSKYSWNKMAHGTLAIYEREKSY